MTRLAENPATLPETLERVAREHVPIIIQRDGRDLAAIISLEDLALLERLREDEEDRLDATECQRILADPNEKPIPWEQAKAELGL